MITLLVPAFRAFRLSVSSSFGRSGHEIKKLHVQRKKNVNRHGPRPLPHALISDFFLKLKKTLANRFCKILSFHTVLLHCSDALPSSLKKYEICVLYLYSSQCITARCYPSPIFFQKGKIWSRLLPGGSERVSVQRKSHFPTGYWLP